MGIAFSVTVLAVSSYLDIFSVWRMNVWFNMVSADTSREAQNYPEKYRSVVVQVAGYSEYFTELHEDLQDDIVPRAEYRLWRAEI